MLRVYFSCSELPLHRIVIDDDEKPVGQGNSGPDDFLDPSRSVTSRRNNARVFAERIVSSRAWRHMLDGWRRVNRDSRLCYAAILIAVVRGLRGLTVCIFRQCSYKVGEVFLNGRRVIMSGVSLSSTSRMKSTIPFVVDFVTTKSLPLLDPLIHEQRFQQGSKRAAVATREKA